MLLHTIWQMANVRGSFGLWWLCWPFIHSFNSFSISIRLPFWNMNGWWREKYDRQILSSFSFAYKTKHLKFFMASFFFIFFFFASVKQIVHTLLYHALDTLCVCVYFSPLLRYFFHFFFFFCWIVHFELHLILNTGVGLFAHYLNSVIIFRFLLDFVFGILSLFPFGQTHICSAEQSIDKLSSIHHVLIKSIQFPYRRG